METFIRIFGFAVALVGFVVSVVVISDSQVDSLVGLSPSGRHQPSELLPRLRLVTRLGLFALLLLVLALVYFLLRRLVFRERLQLRELGPFSGFGIVSQREGLREMCKRLDVDLGIGLMRIWGYSLNWSSTLSQYLEQRPRRAMAVRIYVPTEAIIGSRFADPYAEERKSVLHIRLKEWHDLGRKEAVAGVEVFESDATPHDLGVMLDEEVAFIHSYEWEMREGTLWHSREALDARRFVKVTADAEPGREFLRYLTHRFTCREVDSKRL